jgi:hypothetical protein
MRQTAQYLRGRVLLPRQSWIGTLRRALRRPQGNDSPVV